MEMILSFILAAAPWVGVGILLAYYFSEKPEEEEDQEPDLVPLFSDR